MLGVSSSQTLLHKPQMLVAGFCEACGRIRDLLVEDGPCVVRVGDGFVDSCRRGVVLEQLKALSRPEGGKPCNIAILDRQVAFSFPDCLQKSSERNVKVLT